MIQIAVLIACHNRREKTLECISRLDDATRRANVGYQIILFDDGSTDGTSDAVKRKSVNTVILKGDGNYFWNRSMHEAFAFAMKRGFRAYLWLNDDTMLNKDAFLKIFEALENNADEAAIVVGAVKDPVYGEIAYGGGRLTSPVLRPFRYQMVQPNGSPKRVDVMNGNVVWIPGVVAQRLGNLDPIFEHGMGDIDYAMRASKNEIGIVQTPGFVGECPRNSIAGTYQDSRLPLRIRLEKIFVKKGLPWRTWFVMCARHGGAFWPIHFLWPYFKVLINRA